MKINYIPLGSFCYPKMLIRETYRTYSESLPFDFNSSPNLSGVTRILEELYEKGTYEIELKEIICTHNENELAISEKNDMFLVHFFKSTDLTESINIYPAPVDKIRSDVLETIKQKFKKRFERLYHLLNDKNTILCFLRVENYDNPYWKVELENLCNVLSKFKNNNKYLVYCQNMIDQEIHYENTKQLNYQYKIPILFYKFFFYDKIILENKKIFIYILEIFERLLNNNSMIITLNNNGSFEKYLLDLEKMKIFKLTNINNHSDFYYENDVLYINTCLNGFEVFEKNNQTGFFEKRLL